ncbi:MAG: hypothetical protein ABW194_08480 [Novosphingobium sp.]
MFSAKSLLASVAAAGLLFANPAFATSTRAGDSLPSASTMVPVDLARASSPIDDASELRGRKRGALWIFAALAAIGLIIALAASGGNGSDSPG